MDQKIKKQKKSVSLNEGNLKPVYYFIMRESIIIINEICKHYIVYRLRYEGILRHLLLPFHQLLVKLLVFCQKRALKA